MTKWKKIQVHDHRSQMEALKVLYAENVQESAKLLTRMPEKRNPMVVHGEIVNKTDLGCTKK